MDLFKLVPVIVSIIIISGIAYAQDEKRAGIFVEPGITNEVSNSSVSYPAPFSSSSGSVNGLGLSARLGIHVSDVVFAGLDGRYSRPEFTDSANHMQSVSDQYNLGPVLGMQTPYWGLRVWGAYVPWGEVDPAESEGVKVKFKNGEGYRVGAGFRIGAVSVNAEYQKMRYDDTNLEKLGTFSFANTDIKSIELENETYVLGLSFPIAF